MNLKINISVRNRHSIYKGVLLLGLVLIISQYAGAQVISNDKAAISIQNGVVVSSKDVANTGPGDIMNDGSLNLSGNYTSNGFTRGNGFYRLGGNWLNSDGVFTPGNSTVIFNGAANQYITRIGGETFNNLSIINSGINPANRIFLSNDVDVKGILSMYTGNIDPGSFIIYLNNPLAAALNYSSTSGSRILGKFKRDISESANYLFPLGTPAHYNPANLKPNSIVSAGSILSEFISSSPGTTGLPLYDPPVEIGKTFENGYWSLKPFGFSTSDYNINLNATGFDSVVTSVTRVVVRTTGGDWKLDGINHVADTVKNVVYRDNLVQNISAVGTEYALGVARPRILDHPDNITVCEDRDPVFSVSATGAVTLRYAWYKEPGVLIQNGAHYSGARTSSLTIINAQLPDAGDYYCIVTDRYKNSTRSLDAKLIVMQIPVASVNPETQPNECSNVATASLLPAVTHFDPLTTFTWERDDPAGITTTMARTGTVASIGDIIPSGTFVNTTDDYITITFTITPVGPAPTYCTGIPITATVTVNPVPRATPLNNLPAICYGGKTDIVLVSPTNMTTGNIHFDYTVTKTGGSLLVGNTLPANNLAENDNIGFTYNNNSDDIQSVHYFITPYNTSICPSGPVYESVVDVHAKPLLDRPGNIITLNPLTCDGGAGRAALRAKISKGAAPYHIVWTGPGTYTRIDSVDIVNLATPGKYIAKVTDNLGCFRKDSLDLNAIFAKPFIRAVPINPGGYNITCTNSTDATMQVAVESGITPSYDYWVVKNATDTIASGNFAARRDPLDPATYKNLAGLGAGGYRMIVRDVNRCISISPVLNMRVPPPITATFTPSTWGNYNVSCKGYADGSVLVKATGGRGFYKYKWSTTDGLITGADNTDKLVNITAGNYKVIVTDTLGCSGTFSVPITQPAGLNLDVLKVSYSADSLYNISCNGGSDGYIKMAISGGSGINTYRWTGPNGYTASSEDITGLKAGTYTCRVSAGMDTSSCKLTPSPTYTLAEPATLNISYTTSHSVNGNFEINCNGGTGFIDITVTGGSIGNYTYVWSTTDGSGIIAGQADQPSLKAGTYHLAVQDRNGCMKAIDIVMKEPPVFGLQLTPQHITCITPGFNNGSVNLEVAGGVAPYAYSWSNGATTQDISGLTAGYYKVTASYNNTCHKTDSVKINLPPQLTFDKQIKSLNSYEISCFGRSDGQISVNPTSGNAPFTYSWTGPGGFTSTDKDIKDLKAGEYRLRITDSNMCKATDTITMREPGPLGMTFALSSSNAGGFNINCAGDSTGLIIVQPINSVNNVTFLWADGFTGRTRTDLGAGTYNVIITDANNCQASGNATLTQPDSIKVSFAVKNPFCPDMPDGAININVKGGVPGAEYLYKWSDNSAGSSLSNIPEGLFKLRVEDLNGCVLRDSVLVEPQNPTCLGVPNIISPNGDLVNDTWIIDRKELYPAMEVKIFNRRGKLVWKSDKGYGKPWDGKGNGVELPIDSYHYIIDLHDGSKPVLGTITIVK